MTPDSLTALDWLSWLQLGLILYFVLLNGTYLMLNVLSMASLMAYMRERAVIGEATPIWASSPRPSRFA